MHPIDPAEGPGRGVMPASAVPAQAMAHGGTFVRPGAVAWGGTRDTPDGAYSSCEIVEQVLAAAIKDPDRVDDFLEELARARLWVPLPGGRPVTDGSAVALPTVVYLGADFVPCFTSVQRLGLWADPSNLRSKRWQRAGDSRAVPHIVVPAVALARRLPADLGLAINPGAEASVPIYPEGVASLAAEHTTGRSGVPSAVPAARPGGWQAEAGLPIGVGDPPVEPEALLRAVGGGLGSVPVVRDASRAWLSVPGEGAGLIISVALDDPASEPAREAVLGAIEDAVAEVPLQAPFPIDVTFPGESEPDLVDDWVAHNTRPFYTRG
jgi:hypothetical protein